MRFFKLLAEVTAGIGTLLNGYCPETTSALPKHAVGIDTACATWVKTVDTVFNPVGHALVGMKGGSLTGWHGGVVEKWRSLFATLDDTWSPDISFVNGTSNKDGGGDDFLDTGGTPEPGALTPGSTARIASDVYTGPKEIMLAPCIICSSLRESPTTTPDDASTTMVADELDSDPEPLDNSADVQKMIVSFAIAVVFCVSHIWIMLNAAERTVIDTHVIPCIRKWIARPLFAFLNYVGWISFGTPIRWDARRKFFIVTKDGRYLSMALLSMTELILADRSLPLDDDDDEEPEGEDAAHDEEPQPPVRFWDPDVRVSTAGPRQTRRGLKKAAKKAKAKKRGG